MVPTTIENKPKTYTRPTLIARNSRPYIPRKEYVEQEEFKSISIQYLFDNNLNSSPSGYDLTSYDSISYETSPTSIYLNGSSYLSSDITIDVKALGFWFKINSPTIDNYLISTTNDVFNIEINNTQLNTTVNTIKQPISYNFLSYKWHHLLLNYSNQKYEIYINSNLAQETVDYTALTNNTLYLGKSLHDSTRILYGNIADLRLYNYSITDISTIYDEFFDNIPPPPTDFTTITFDKKTIGSPNMLSSVPNGTTELNIINNSILYNSNYEEGSGLYIDFTKTNLENVIKVTITNFGTIYGRGGIGETSSDNKRIGKHAIKVLSNDNINREITIINNSNIYGGGNGGYFIFQFTIAYPFILSYSGGASNGTSYAIINVNAEGGDAQYYNGTDVIDAGAPYILPGNIILENRPSLVDTASLTYEYVDRSYADKPLNNGGKNFDTTDKIIDLPSNGSVTKTYINNN